MPSEARFAPNCHAVYQRAYAAVAALAFHDTGYLSATAFQALKFSAGPDVVDSMLLHLRNSGLLHITHSPTGEVAYDFLPLLEKMTAETPPESDMHVRLARLYCRRSVPNIFSCSPRNTPNTRKKKTFACPFFRVFRVFRGENVRK